MFGLSSLPVLSAEEAAEIMNRELLPTPKTAAEIDEQVAEVMMKAREDAQMFGSDFVVVTADGARHVPLSEVVVLTLESDVPLDN